MQVEQYLPYNFTKYILNIEIVTTWLGNGHTELSIAQGSNGCDNTSHCPHNEGQAYWTGILQNSLWANKDPRPNDIACKWGNKGKVTCLVNRFLMWGSQHIYFAYDVTIHYRTVPLPFSVMAGNQIIWVSWPQWNHACLHLKGQERARVLFSLGFP